MNPEQRILALICEDLEGQQPKPAEPPEPDDALTINKYHVPTLTPEDIVRAAQTGRGPWTTLQRLHEEDLAEKRQKIRDRYIVTLQPIPEPEWDELPEEFKP